MDLGQGLRYGTLGGCAPRIGLQGTRIPAFATAGIKQIVNGPDGYTPDGRCLMGPVPGVKNVIAVASSNVTVRWRWLYRMFRPRSV
jgi:hypothetical protein